MKVMCIARFNQFQFRFRFQFIHSLKLSRGLRSVGVSVWVNCFEWRQSIKWGCKVRYIPLSRVSHAPYALPFFSISLSLSHSLVSRCLLMSELIWCVLYSTLCSRIRMRAWFEIIIIISCIFLARTFSHFSQYTASRSNALTVLIRAVSRSLARCSQTELKICSDPMPITNETLCAGPGQNSSSSSSCRRCSSSNNNQNNQI